MQIPPLLILYCLKFMVLPKAGGIDKQVNLKAEYYNTIFGDGTVDMLVYKVGRPLKSEE